MTKRRKLKEISMTYDTETQVMTISDKSGQTVTFNKVYMFSVFTFIKQIAYSNFIKIGQVRQLERMKAKKAQKALKAGENAVKAHITK